MEAVKHIEPQFIDLKTTHIDFENTAEVLKRARDHWQETRKYQERATVNIDTDWPVTVVAIGDVHFGSVYSDIDRFRRDIDLVAETPGVYTVLMSNLIDNAMPSQFPDSMLANALHPQDQAQGMNDLVRRLDKKNKVLGAVRSSCHEGWTWKHTGQDVNDLLFNGTEFPRLENGGILDIKLRGADYKMAIFHKFGPFGSHFNKSHPMQQMQRIILGGEADVVIGAHSHFGEALQTFYGTGTTRRDVVYLRSGTYKGNIEGRIENTPDMWLRDRSGTDGEPGGQAVMLRGDRKEMQAFLKPDTAVEFHTALYTARRMESVGIIGRMNEVLDKTEEGQRIIIYNRE